MSDYCKQCGNTGSYHYPDPRDRYGDGEAFCDCEVGKAAKAEYDAQCPKCGGTGYFAYFCEDPAWDYCDCVDGIVARIQYRLSHLSEPVDTSDLVIPF